MFLSNLRLFHSNTSGGIAALTGLLAIPMIGAIGLGVDVYRGENASTALDHVTSFACRRVAEADMAHYRTAAEKRDLGVSFARDAARQTSLSASRSTFGVDVSTNSVRVTGTTTLDSAFMGLFGFGAMTKRSEQTCPITPGETTEQPGCPEGTMILTNTDQLSATISSMTRGSAYMASVISPSQQIRHRSSFGQGQMSLRSFISGVNPDDYIVLQRRRADGTFPAPCSPTRPPGCVSVATCPPPPTSKVCPQAVPGFSDLAGAGELEDDQSAPNPKLRSLVSGNVLHYVASNGDSLKLPVTNPFDSTAPRTKYIADQFTFLETVARMTNGQNGPLRRTLSTIADGGRLYRIVSDRDSIWELRGQCVYVISPIVLDLIEKGHIVTTGVTSGRMPLPMPVKHWRWFDLYGTGQPVRTEWIVGNGQGLLVDNRDGAAVADMSGSRLFGNGHGFANGYEKLAMLDANADGKLTGAELEGLLVWVDNGDAAAHAEEMRTLAELDITEVSVNAWEAPGKLGETHLRSTATMQGREIMTEDVWFNTNIAKDIVASWAQPASAPASIEAK